MNEGFDDGENLLMFFNVLKKYNNNTPLEPEFTKKIEDYFEFKWKFDRN